MHTCGLQTLTDNYHLNRYRLFYVGSQEQQVPRVMGMISMHYSTPVFSLVISCILSLIMLITSDVYVLISYFSVTLWLWTGVVTAALIQLRIKRPELHRPIKFSLTLPFLFTIGCFALTAVAIYADPKGSSLGLLFMFAGLPAYYVQRYLAKTTSGTYKAKYFQFSSKIAIGTNCVRNDLEKSVKTRRVTSV